MSADTPPVDAEEHGTHFFGLLEYDADAEVCGRPRGMTAHRRWNRMPASIEGARWRHVFMGAGGRRNVQPGEAGAEHVGEFDHHRWPEVIVACVREVAAARGVRWVCVHSSLELLPLPSSWWVAAGELARDSIYDPVSGEKPVYLAEHWLVAERYDWSVTIDEYGVLRAFGDEAFVDAFAAAYERATR